jgi:hypothetical protein
VVRDRPRGAFGRIAFFNYLPICRRKTSTLRVDVMHIVEFRRDADLADAMSEMRRWLDLSRITPKCFTFSAADRGLVFRLEF